MPLEDLSDNIKNVLLYHPDERPTVGNRSQRGSIGPAKDRRAVSLFPYGSAGGIEGTLLVGETKSPIDGLMPTLPENWRGAKIHDTITVMANPEQESIVRPHEAVFHEQQDIEEWTKKRTPNDPDKGVLLRKVEVYIILPFSASFERACYKIPDRTPRNRDVSSGIFIHSGTQLSPNNFGVEEYILGEIRAQGAFYTVVYCPAQPKLHFEGKAYKKEVASLPAQVFRTLHVVCDQGAEWTVFQDNEITNTVGEFLSRAKTDGVKNVDVVSELAKQGANGQLYIPEQLRAKGDQGQTGFALMPAHEASTVTADATTSLSLCSCLAGFFSRMCGGNSSTSTNESTPLLK